ncbi:MAG: hypothetical protein KDG89_04625, partial [Geminicoccaceae bacterium]|nr:hypothetical protein [Geminicoccaceae bacterium]
RLDAVTRYRGQLERGQFRLLKALRERRGARAADAVAPVRNEPGAAAATGRRNEPEAPLSDSAAPPVRNEPEATAFAPAPRPRATAAPVASPANDPFGAAVRRILKEAGKQGAGPSPPDETNPRPRPDPLPPRRQREEKAPRSGRGARPPG